MSASARADARCRTILRILMQRDRSVIYNKKILNNLAKMFRSVLCYSLPCPPSEKEKPPATSLPRIYLTQLGQVRSKEIVAKGCNFPCVLYFPWLGITKMCDCSPSLAGGLQIAWVHSLSSLGIKNCVVALHPSIGDKNGVVALLPSLGIKNVCGCTPSLTDLTRYSR